MTAPRSNTPTIDRLLDSEEDPSRLWAEIHRLRAALQGPGGYATWQDAATAERIRRVKAEKYLANFDIAGLGAVLTYTSHGRSSVHGMTIGADGSGDFAVLFMGAWAESESAAAEYLGRLQQAGYRISTAHIVPNQRRFSGDSVRVVDAPLARNWTPNRAVRRVWRSRSAGGKNEHEHTTHQNANTHRRNAHPGQRHQEPGRGCQRGYSGGG